MIAACLKWVDTRPEVDRLTGEVRVDERTSGASDADRAALEWALRLGETAGEEVVAVTAGPAVAEPVLREALAAGAARAVRVELPLGAPSEQVAAALAGALRGASLVVCGVWSADRGSGSVPAFLAGHLGAAQALGLVALAGGPAGLAVERRLDGGRRERLQVPVPAVLSVEGSSARLRRASLPAVVHAREAVIEVQRPQGQSPGGHTGEAVQRRPFRPRPRVLPAPPPGLSARERILALTGALAERTPPRLLVLDPDAAAGAILDQLRTWGYLDER